jgi:biopolymer transport protein TolR
MGPTQIPEKAMAVKAQSGLSAEPNVTPMIDVLLVVIIVFMVAMVQVYHTMDVVLPVPCAGACDGSEQVVLEVLPGPRYRVNKQPIAEEALPAELNRIYSARPDKIIHVAGDPHVRYDDIIAAMDIAKSAGVRVIGVAPKALSVER